MALHDFVDWKYPSAQDGVNVPRSSCGHGCGASSCKPSCSTGCGGSGCGAGFFGQRMKFGGKRKDS